MRRPRTLRWALGITYLVVVAAGAFLAFVVVEHAAGRVPAFVALVAFFCAPIGAAVLVEKAAAKLRRELHAENLTAWLLPFWSAGFVAPVRLRARADRRCVARRPRASRVGERLARGAHPAPRPGPLAPRRAAERAPTRGGGRNTGRAAALVGCAFSGIVGARAVRVVCVARAARACPRAVRVRGPDVQEDVAGCEPLAPIDAVQSAYVPGATRATAEALAKARYPVGLPFLQAQDDKQLLVWFTRAPETFDGVAASRFDAAVHEGAHLWGIKRFNPGAQTYPVRDGL